MRKGQNASLHSAIIVAICLSVGVAFPQQTARFGPTLQLEKPVYVVDEAIRFWIGVTADSPIPQELWSSCILHWTHPDGSRTDEHVDSPRDGDASMGWGGGWGFGTKSPSLGHYVVSFEFAGQRTADQTFKVVPNPFADSIEAHWIFVETKSGGDVHSRGVFLHVENKTGRVLHFAKPGLTGSEVSLHIKQFQPTSSEYSSVPSSALLQPDEIPSFSLANDRLEWSNQMRWPMVAVPDGGSADRNLALPSVHSFRDGQEYEVTISTVLTVFVGERDDVDAQLFPLRIPVSGTARFRW
jgi:hypothetical protein